MKRWKRLIAAVLIGVFALTLFAGCGKTTIKVEDELMNQLSDYSQLLGTTFVKEKSNSNAESVLKYISAHCTGSFGKSFFGTTKNWKWTPTEEGQAVFALLPDAATTDYRIAWVQAVTDPKSEYFKDPQTTAARILNEAFLDGNNSVEVYDGSLEYEDTGYVSIAQGKIGGTQYYIIVTRYPQKVSAE